MADHAKSAATAERLIAKNGRAVSLVKRNTAPDDAGQPWRGSSDAADAGQGGDPGLPLTAVFVPASGSGLGRLVKDVTGALVRELDQVCIVAAASTAGIDIANYTSVLDDDGTTWKIVAAGTLRPGSIRILFVLGLKK